MNKLISFRIPQNLESECRDLSDRLGYANIQEFLREALRDKVIESKRSLALYAIKNLPKQKGVRASKEELSLLAKKHFE